MAADDEVESLEARASLPVEMVASQLRDAVRDGRVTLVYGATGSGKSTRVPGIVRDALRGRVLCSMPRRLAATSAATRCASELDPPALVGGDEVGSHIGSERRCNDRTRVVFCTAGVLVELIRSNGESSLDRFCAIILDECHERSTENDLALALVRALMARKTNLRVVLMSATFDAARYEAYFERFIVSRVVIPEAPPGRFLVFHRSSTEYLEGVLRLPGLEAHAGVAAVEVAGASALHLPPALHSLIASLVLHLHEHVCRSPAEVILVFLPTYRALEHQFELLAASGAALNVQALHSSIDTETSARAIAEEEEGDDNDGRRKVILATNVAESSVTIPGVTCVVDSCRTLGVVWDRAAQRDVATVRWISKSQAEQRKGRTGRTCAGTVYRLITRRQYDTLPSYEPPALRTSSLRDAALVLACSTSSATSDPQALLGSCLDPPERTVVAEALSYLARIDAVALTATGKPRPTALGSLLVALPLTLSPAARLAVQGGHEGVPADVAALAAVVDKSPLPILQPFGDSTACCANLRRYAPHARPADRVSVLMANLAAYEFWTRVRCDGQRWGALLDLAATPASHPTPPAPAVDANAEERWCAAHGLSLTALLQVAHTVSGIIDAMHKWRPDFIASPASTPAWVGGLRQHACSHHADGADTPCALPVSQLGELFPDGLAGRLERMLCALQEQEEDAPPPLPAALAAATVAPPGAPACLFFTRRGGCTRPECRFAHVAGGSGARLPPDCKFFGTRTGCSFGARCSYYHDPALAPPERAASASGAAAPRGSVRAVDVAPQAAAGDDSSHDERLLGEVSAGTTLLLGEGDFSFAQALFRRTATPLIATSLQSRAEVEATFPAAAARLDALQTFGVTLLHGVDATRLDRVPAGAIPWDAVRCVLWNHPYDGDAEGDAGAQRALLRASLRSLALHLLRARALNDDAGAAGGACVLLTLCNDQAARWSLEELAREALLYVESSWPLRVGAEGAWPGYAPVRNDADAAFSAHTSVTYCLSLGWDLDADEEEELLSAMEGAAGDAAQ
jgi:HrpA-like RNA helicase